MNLAGVGPAELLLILIIALLIFGPAKLPEIAKDLGKSIQRWRQALDVITEDPDSLTPSSPSKEATMQASVQTVIKSKRKENASSDDEATAGEEKTEETEVETECQT